MVDNSVNVCNKIINVTDSVSSIVTNTNVTSTMSINSDDKKVRDKMDCYVLHTFLLLIVILLFTTAVFFCYHYLKYR